MNSYENSSIYKWLNGEVPTELETGFYAAFVPQEDNQPVYWVRAKDGDA